MYWLGKTMKGDNAPFYRFFPYLTGLCTKIGSQPSTNFIYTATKLIKTQCVRYASAAHSVCRMKQARYNKFAL